MRPLTPILLGALLTGSASWCGRAPGSAPAGRAASSMKLETNAFTPGGFIPARYTCKGGDVSPPLAWSNSPGNGQGFALILEDPDAPGGTWTHWLVYNLPSSAHGLPEGIPKMNEIQGGGRQGVNDFGNIGYGGPCPPPGKAHRYYFHLYALNAPLALKAGASKAEVRAALGGKVLAQTDLMGRFKR
jgi:Raf kinase inhibitor-like YbhB/YbcL family protein